MSRNFRALFSVFALLGLVGCNQTISGLGLPGTQSTTLSVGPKTSSVIEASEARQVSAVAQKLDVVIPVFDPGLKEPAEDGVWPELRRAEANRFAVSLKRELERTREFGAVRVTPDANATAEIYVLGEIIESDGEEVVFSLQVLDIAGNDLIAAKQPAGLSFLNKALSADTAQTKKFKHKVPRKFFSSARNKGKDPYQPAFADAASYVVKLLKSHTAQEKMTLKHIADLRFGSSLSDGSFEQHLSNNKGKVQLVSMPHEDDAVFAKVRALRIKDQLFIDDLQENYLAFNSKLDESYGVWQEQALFQANARQEAKKKAAGQALGALLAIGVAVATADSMDYSDGFGSSTVKATAAIAAGAAGIGLIGDSIKSVEEAKLHQDLIEELGSSIDLDLAPTNIAFEDQQKTLTGDAEQQFTQWREFLKVVYEQDKTPDIQL